MLNRSCLGHDTMGYPASPMQLSLVVKSSQGRGGAASPKSLYNNPDAALTVLRDEMGFGSSLV
jgi:hypothetical protein